MFGVAKEGSCVAWRRKSGGVLLSLVLADWLATFKKSLRSGQKGLCESPGTL